MTKKNARKTAARERQAKVGGKYMTAWKAVGTARAETKTEPTSAKLRNIRARWLTHENVYRCIYSKNQLIGVTDGYDGIEWMPLSVVKVVPEFDRWWKSLPEATPYDKADQEEGG